MARMQACTEKKQAASISEDCNRRSFDHLKITLASRRYGCTTVSSLQSQHIECFADDNSLHLGGFHCRSPHKLYSQEICQLLRSGDLDGVRAAVTDEATANGHNKQGQTLLMIACRMLRHAWSVEMVQILLAAGATPLACCDAGKTALHDLCWCAEGEGHEGVQRAIEVLKLLAEWRSPHDGVPGNSMLLCQDRFRATPLEYLKSRSWPSWNACITAMQKVWWPDPERSLLDGYGEWNGNGYVSK